MVNDESIFMAKSTNIGLAAMNRKSLELNRIIMKISQNVSKD